MNRFLKCKKGLTLIEIIVSIAIISIIAISFIPLFVMSAKSNANSEISLESTYLGKDAMELAYELSRTIEYGDLEDNLTDKGWYFEEDGKFSIEFDDDKYLLMKFEEKDDNLVKILVKVYKGKDSNQLEAQYETLYIWGGI